MNSGGFDTEGKNYRNANHMWEEEVATPSEKDSWYGKGIDYWQKVEPSVDGVLGGFGHISPTDVEHSRGFLNKVFGENIDDAINNGQELVAADCGAGVGRITKEFLSHIFHEVDVIEPVAHFVQKARENLKDAPSKVNFLTKSLQDVCVAPNRYDVVWIQWCIGHLTDDDAVAFLKVCAQSLKPGGMIVVKENNARRGFVLDKDDNSITRSDAYLVQVFQKAGLRILTSQIQEGFPDGLFMVRAYALQPADAAT